MTKKTLITGLKLCPVFAFGLMAAQAQEIPQPLVEFTFEGESLANTGSLGGEGVFENPRGDDQDIPTFGSNLIPGTTGFGPSATNLDNTFVGWMGHDGSVSGPDRPGAMFYEAGSGLVGLESITITGWYRAAELFDGNARIADQGSTFTVTGREGEFRVEIRGGEPGNEVFRWINAGVEEKWHRDPDRWTFFAVTFDNTISIFDQEPNARVYYAYLDSEGITLDATAHLENDPTKNTRDIDELVLGNSSFQHSPFKGHIDNIRIYGSDSDGSGALSEEQIYAIWEGDRASPNLAGAAEARIHTAVELEFDTEEGRIYQIESSTDLETWMPASLLIEGEGEPIERFFSTREDERKFFRVVTD